MHRKIFIWLSIAFIVLASQCVGPISTGSKKTEVKESELLKIKLLDIAPSTHIHPGETLLIRMEVENIGQTNADIFVNISNGDGCSVSKLNGGLLLYSVCEPLYKIEEFRILSPGKLKIESADINYDGKKEKICVYPLKPGDVAVFFWKISAPSEKEIFGMSYDCTFKFKVSYLSEAKTTAYIYFASPTELAQRIYTKEDLSMAGNNIATFGPVVAMVDAEDQPYPAGGTFSLPVTLENMGNGIAQVLSLTIKYPQAFSVNEQNCELFNNHGNELTVKTTQDAMEMLKIYGKKSSRFYCEFKVPDVEILTPYRFDVAAKYIYSTFMEKKIEITPYT